MRRSVLVLLQIALTIPLFGQAGGDLVHQRWNAEGAFIAEYLSKLSNEVPVGSTEALDKSITTLLKAWALEYPGTDSNSQLLGSDTYVIVLRSLFAGRPPQWAQCHTWQTYMIDSWLRNFAYFRSEPTADKAFLIQVNAFALAASCPMPDPVTWSRLSEAYAEMPEIIDAYLAAEAYARPDVRDWLVALKSELAGMQDIWTIRTLVSDKEPDKAFGHLTGVIQDSLHIPGLVEYYGGKVLMDYYVQRGDMEQGSSVLDLISPLLRDAGVSPDTLEAWHARVNRVYDERAMPRDERARSIFAEGEVWIPRAGTLLNVTTNEPFNLASLEGKIVMLDFWATWCAPCIAELPDLQQFAQDFDTREDFVFISVSSDGATGGASPEELQSFLQERGIEYIVLYDDSSVALADHFGVRGYPSKFLIDAEGRQLAGADLVNGQVSLGSVRAYLAEE